MKLFKDHTKALIVITTQTSWNEIPRMRHNVALQLSKQNNILFVELDSPKNKSFNIISDSLVVLKLGGYIRGLSRINFLKSIFNIIQAYEIKKIVNKINSSNKIILNFKFDFYQIYFTDTWTLNYYFMNDDFINMPYSSSSRQKNKRRKLQNKTISSSSRIFLSADALANFVEVDKKISVIYSGHDFEINSKFKIKNNIKPILCFMGYIHNDLELDWLEALARTNNYEIRLIGPLENNEIGVKLKIIDNIRLFDSLVGQELYHFLRESDGFLMPYKELPAKTVTSVPAKLFQYLACGKPIISNELPNLIKLPSFFVYQASSKEDFVNMVSIALNNHSEDKYKKRILFAAENTWDRRGEKMNEIIVKDLNCLKNIY